MKRFITGALGAIGLAPAGHVARAAADGTRAHDKLRELEQRLVDAKADAANWKRRHDEVSRRAAEHQDAAAKANTRAERAEARAEELKTRGDRFQDELRQMRASLQEAGRSTKTVREHLMATETKLDLIEAAIQVLDLRTREVATDAGGKLRT